jgi:hypothetical protein
LPAKDEDGYMDEKDNEESPLQILVVEDYADLAESMTILLREHGHKFDVA